MSRLVDAYRRDVFRNSELLGELSEDEIDKVLAQASLRTAAKNETILHKGEPSDCLYGVLAGRAAVVGIAPEGKQIAIRMVEPGEVFGEISLLDGLPRTADIVALERTDYFALHRRDFEALVLGHPKLAMRMMAMLARRLRLTSETLEEVAFLPLRVRLAKTLLRLVERYGQPHEGGHLIRLRLPVRTIADLVGSTRETTNMVIREWEKEGILARDQRRLVVRELEELARMVSPD